MMYPQAEILCAETGDDVATEAQSAAALVEVFAEPETGAVEKNTPENQSISGVLEAGTAFDVTLIDNVLSPKYRRLKGCNGTATN